jgi:hypothetical protein
MSIFPHWHLRRSSNAYAAHLFFVLLVRLGWQQGPQGVDAERGAEGDVEQCEESENDREDARSRFALEQARPTRKPATAFANTMIAMKPRKGCSHRSGPADSCK